MQVDKNKPEMEVTLIVPLDSPLYFLKSLNIIISSDLLSN